MPRRPATPPTSGGRHRRRFGRPALRSIDEPAHHLPQVVRLDREGTRMCTPRVDPPQRVHERGEVDGRLIQIVDRAVGVLTGQPLVHGPVEGIALGRMPHRQLHRKRERQVWREPRQPLSLLHGLLGGPPDARQPGGKVVTEPVGVVIGPVRHDRSDRQTGPLRELPCERSTHERDVSLDLVGMHLGCAHRRHHHELRQRWQPSFDVPAPHPSVAQPGHGPRQRR